MKVEKNTAPLSAAQLASPAEVYQKALERLWDILSDAIEGGRLKESDIPDDYAAFVDQMQQCNVALKATTSEAPRENTILELLKTAGHALETPGDFTADELYQLKSDIGEVLAGLEEADAEAEAESNVKYYIGKIHERNGEHDYVHTHCFMTDGDPAKHLDEVASRYYDEAGGDEEEDGSYSFDSGCINVTPGITREITKDFYVQCHELGVVGRI